MRCSVSNENVAASAATTALSSEYFDSSLDVCNSSKEGKKRTLDTVDPTLQVTQATIVNPPTKKPRKGVCRWPVND